jgi:DNA-binding NtrC family response regulator
MGLMATANGGTLFLDEIGDLPLNEQAKLLRVLQEKEVRPVGSNHIVPLDVRVISATNRDLETAVGNNTFRRDLFFRLNVLELYVPPLRNRRSDIPLLARYFLEKFCGSDAGAWTISAEAMERLTAYDWPGNVRELEHAIECGVAFCSSFTVQVDDLPSSIRYGTCKESAENNSVFNMKENKRRMIVLALGETRGDKMAAARILGIGKTTIYRLLKEDKELEARLADQIFN